MLQPDRDGSGGLHYKEKECDPEMAQPFARSLEPPRDTVAAGLSAIRLTRGGHTVTAAADRIAAMTGASWRSLMPCA